MLWHKVISTQITIRMCPKDKKKDDLKGLLESNKLKIKINNVLNGNGSKRMLSRKS